MLTHALCIVLAAAAANQRVLNPDFEQTVNERPLRWELFVQPMEGAYGRLSDEAYTGERSVMLHIPEPYLRDPANNWNQTIFGDFAGGTVEVSGHIKTENAADAAIWLQCWQQPARLLQTISSASITPVYGTSDWRRVSFTADVPSQTDFLVLRCVLQGEGTAWFDQVELTVRPAPDEAASEEAPELVELPAAPLEQALSAAGAASVLEAAAALSEAVQRLRDSNESLQQRFETIEAELDSLRGALSAMETSRSALEAPLPEEAEEAPETPPRRLPVLVPYGTVSGRTMQ